MVFSVYLRRAMLFLCLSGGFLGVISRLTVVDLDLFHQMALIREAFRVGYLPRVDVFSYTPTVTPFVHHEWGMGMIIYFITVQSGLGDKGLIILKYFLTAFIATSCFFFSVHRRGADHTVFLFLAFLGIPMSWAGFTTIRAQLFTLSFLVIFFFLIEADRKGKTWALWAWLPVCVVWANIHGGFLVGIGLLIAYVGEQFFINRHEKGFIKAFVFTKRQMFFMVATCLLVLINPYGSDLLYHLWEALTLEDRTKLVFEWRPLWKISWGSVLAWFCSLVLVVYCKPWKSVKEISGVFIIAVTAWVSLWHFRHLSIYAVAWMCYAPALVGKTPLGEMIKKVFKHNSKFITTVFIIIGISGTLYAIRNQFWSLRIPTKAVEHNDGVPVYPAGVVTYLKDNNFSGNLFVPFEAGSYVSWKLYPNVKVSLDSRFEAAYPVQSVIENVKFYAAEEGWREISTKYHTDAILVPRWSRLDQEVNKNDGIIRSGTSSTWIRVYIDDGYSLYIKSCLAKYFVQIDRRGQAIPACFP